MNSSSSATSGGGGGCGPAEDYHYHMSKKKSNGGGSSSSSSSKKPPKGILKNSNPNATYHDHIKESGETNHNNNNKRYHRSSSLKKSNHHYHEEDNQQQQQQHSTGRKHKHKHHRSSSRNSNHSVDSGDTASTSSHHTSSSSSSSRRSKKSIKMSSSSSSNDNGTNIYDRPKVPATKVKSRNKSPETSIDEGVQMDSDLSYYENLNFNNRSSCEHGESQPIYDNDVMKLYDVPKNKIISGNESNKEAIYMNSGLSENDFYDVPKSTPVLLNGSNTSTTTPTPLTTIEEEYSPPSPPLEQSVEDIYQNYPVENIYANEECFNSSSDRGSSGYRSSPSIQSNEELYVNESAIASLEDVRNCSPPNSPPISDSKRRDIAIGTTANSVTKDKKKKTTVAAAAPPDLVDLNAKELQREKERERAARIEREILKKRDENKNNRNKERERKNNPHQTFITTQQIQISNIKSSSSSPAKKSSSIIDSIPPPPPPPPQPASSSRESPVLNNIKPPTQFDTLESNKKIINGLVVEEEESRPIEGGIEFEEFEISDTPVQRRSVVVPEPKNEFFGKRVKSSSSFINNKPSSPTLNKTSSSSSIVDDSTFTRKSQREQQNRSFDVYNETVRQRGVSRKTDVRGNAFFTKETNNNNNDRRTLLIENNNHGNIKRQSEQKGDKDDDDDEEVQGRPEIIKSHVQCDFRPTRDEEEDMPSVQQLRSRFEQRKKLGKSNAITSLSSFNNSAVGGGGEGGDKNEKLIIDPSPVTTAAKVFNATHFHNNLKSGGNKKFMVMASLTRRSAMTITKTLKDIELNEEKLNNIEKSTTTENKKKTTPNTKTTTSWSNEEEEKDKIITNNSNNNFTSSKYDEKNPLWDPTDLIAELYRVSSSENETCDGDSQLLNDKYEDRIEGFLDRLPVGKKKPTVWKTWKTQYFDLNKGILTIYNDASKIMMMDKFELFGGKIEKMEGEENKDILEIYDRKGTCVVIRISEDGDDEGGDKKERWRKRLKRHTKKDYASTFITPVPIDMNLLTDVIVVDFGGSSVRAGIAGKVPTLPTVFFPSVMAVATENPREKYFGLDVFSPEIRGRCALHHPMIPSGGVIDKLSVDQIAFQGILEKIFKDLSVDPSDYQIQLSVPRSLNDKTKIALTSILFEEFGVKAVNMSHQSVLAMYAYQARTGVVVDIGERMDIVPIVDGYKVQAGISRSPVGAHELRSKMQHYLLGRNYSLTSFVDNFVIRSVLEKSAYVAPNFDKELERDQNEIETVVTAPGIPPMAISTERFEAVEGLFKPELWGLDQAGVHVLVHKAIRECPMDVRKEITQNIYLSGGLTRIPGFSERLELEMMRLSPNIKPKVHNSPYSYHAAYLGAATHSLSDTFKQTRIMENEWHSSQGNSMARMWTL